MSSSVATLEEATPSYLKDTSTSVHGFVKTCLFCTGSLYRSRVMSVGASNAGAMFESQNVLTASSEQHSKCETY